jgi:ABC-type branched-subunit amino acid transport system substrate-binding protein
MVVTKVLLWLLLAVAVTAKVRYDKHQVFRIVPADNQQLEALRNLQKEIQKVSCV